MVNDRHPPRSRPVMQLFKPPLSWCPLVLCVCIYMCRVYIYLSGKVRDRQLVLACVCRTGATGSRDTDKGKHCVLLRAQVGAGTHFPPLNIFYSDKVCVLVCICEEKDLRALSSSYRGNCNLVGKNTLPPIHPPPPTDIFPAMTSSLSDLQEQLHDFMSYSDTGTRIAGSRGAACC